MLSVKVVKIFPNLIQDYRHDLSQARKEPNKLGTPSPSDKELGTLAPSDKELGTPATSVKELGTPAPSDKELGKLAPSNKELDTPALSHEKLGKPSRRDIGYGTPTFVTPASSVNKIDPLLICLGNT